MAQKIIHTDQAPAPVGPYSQAVEVGNLVFCSGQIAIDPKTNEVLKGSVEEQARLVMKNVEALLKGAGVSCNHVVKTTIYLTDMNDFAKVNAVYGEYFTNTPPARSTVAVSALPKGVNVEVEVIAHK
jgi:2-iminobutanoate/2-iminopropanoate deaminase